MKTQRCWQSNVVSGFGKTKTRKTVVERKKIRRMMVRSIVKKLKAKGSPIDLQAINKDVVNMFRRRHQSRKRA